MPMAYAAGRPNTCQLCCIDIVTAAYNVHRAVPCQQTHAAQLKHNHSALIAVGTPRSHRLHSWSMWRSPSVICLVGKGATPCLMEPPEETTAKKGRGWWHCTGGYSSEGTTCAWQLLGKALYDKQLRFSSRAIKRETNVKPHYPR